jgi:indolepyruvate ferredoxin oxidoreductase alpha subunit
MTGEQALVQTLLENEIALVTGVYGDPCTSLLDLAAGMSLNVEISVEEKTAVAQALGASVAGRRTAVAIKQVGLNVGIDPLVNAVTHGIGAGLLIIAGDDPGAEKSTNEQDSRWYAKLAELPVLTPRDPDHLARAAAEGLDLSEELGIPVMLHITSRLLHSEGRVGRYRIQPHGHFDRDRAWKNLIFDRHKYFYREIDLRLQSRVENSGLHQLAKERHAKEGVISCGYLSSLVECDAHLALGYAHPLPEKLLLSFLEGLEQVLIVEEVAPIVEEGVLALVGKHRLPVKVLGRLSGHLPRIGKLEREQIATAFSLVPQGVNLDAQTQVNSSIMELLCGGFEMLYQCLDELLPQGYLIAGDVGCSILHGYFPPQVIDTAFALGTPIATAGGMSLSGRKGIAIIGDTGFVHSGITGLLNAVEQDHDVLVIILFNQTTAMTPGKQAIKGLNRIKRLVEACGVTAIDEIDMDAIDQAALTRLLTKRLAERGVHVLIAKARPRKLTD